MAPKKPMRSPFGLFMAKMRSEDKSLNNKPMDQIVKICNEEYVKLSPEEKKHFKTLSDLVRNQSLTDSQLNRRFTYVCISSQNNNNKRIISDNEDNNEDEDWDKCETNFRFSKLESKIEKVIESDEELAEDLTDYYSIVKNAVKSVAEVKTIPIIVISFNVSVQTQDGISYPIEVSLTKFSLIKGIEDSYHQLIYNPIPKGYYSVAKEFSEKTHEIPLNPEKDFGFEKNYAKIFEDIKHFMALSGLKNKKSGQKLVFCKTIGSDGKGDVRQVIACLKWLSKEMEKEKRLDYKSLTKDFQMIDLSELLFVLHQKMSSTARPRSVTSDDLSKVTYDFSQLSCHFHLQKENKYCTLAVTKRLAYLFFDSLFASLKPQIHIQRTDNHKPEEEKIDSEISQINYRPINPKPLPHFRFHSCHRKDSSTHENSSVGIHKSADIRQPIKTGIGRGRNVQQKKFFN